MELWHECERAMLCRVPGRTRKVLNLMITAFMGDQHANVIHAYAYAYVHTWACLNCAVAGIAHVAVRSRVSLMITAFMGRSTCATSFITPMHIHVRGHA